MLRWILFICWTAFILYSMDVFTPSDSRLVGRITQWFIEMGLPAWMPHKLFHLWAFFMWSFFLAGALAGGYWRLLLPKGLNTCVYSLVAFVAIPEVLQYFNALRTPALLDVAVNLFGGALGLYFRCAASRLAEGRLARQR